MISLPANRPGEGMHRAFAFAAALLLPLLVVAALGDTVTAGPGVLLLALPVLVVAGVGGIGPGLLATAVGAAPAVLRFGPAAGGTEAALWIAAYVAIGIAASVLFERSRRLVTSLSSERDRLQAEHRFQRRRRRARRRLRLAGTHRRWSADARARHAGIRLALGLTAADVNTRGGWGALVHPGDRPAFDAQLRALGESGHTASELRYEVRRGVAAAAVRDAPPEGRGGRRRADHRRRARRHGAPRIGRRAARSRRSATKPPCWPPRSCCATSIWPRGA